MLILGVLSILQMLFIPGYLTLRVLKLKADILQTVILSFGLSLLLNYCGVYALLLGGVYRAGAVYLLLGAELVALLALERHRLAEWSEATLNYNNLRTTLSAKLQASISETSDLYKVGLLVAVLTLAYALQYVYNNIGTIFTLWDSVISWNEWAVLASQNNHVVNTGYYPQLLPYNWSISYVMTGHVYEVFPKFIMPLFLIGMLLILLDLGIKRRSYAYFVAMVLTVYIVKNNLEQFISEGFADIPVAFMSLSALYCLLSLRPQDAVERTEKAWLVGLALAAGAAVTKQAGCFILLIYPVLAMMLSKAVINRHPFGTAFLRRWGCLIFLLYAIPLAFYAYEKVLITAGVAQSNVIWLTSGMQGRMAWPGKIQALMAHVECVFAGLIFQNRYFSCLQLLLYAVAFFRDKVVRRIFLLYMLPFSVLWALFFSYSIRNASVLMPLLAMVLGVGFEQLLQLKDNFIVERLKGVRLRTAALGLLAVALLVNLEYSGAELSARQTSMLKERFDPVVNRSMYSYWDQLKAKKKILCDYRLDYLPGFEGYISAGIGEDKDGSYANYRRALADVSFGFLLMRRHWQPMINEDIKRRLTGGELEFLFEVNAYQFYKITHAVPAAGLP